MQSRMQMTAAAAAAAAHWRQQTRAAVEALAAAEIVQQVCYRPAAATYPCGGCAVGSGLLRGQVLLCLVHAVKQECGLFFSNKGFRVLSSSGGFSCCR